MGKCLHRNPIASYVTHSTYGDRFSIIKHPKVMEICREKGICIEMCPISYVLSQPLRMSIHAHRVCYRNEVLVRLTHNCVEEWNNIVNVHIC